MEDECHVHCSGMGRSRGTGGHGMEHSSDKRITQGRCVYEVRRCGVTRSWVDGAALGAHRLQDQSGLGREAGRRLSLWDKEAA